jgi:hypothetical protein
MMAVALQDAPRADRTKVDSVGIIDCDVHPTVGHRRT